MLLINSPQPNSCYNKFKIWISAHPRATANTKIILLSTACLASLAVIPVPVLNTAMAGGCLFLTAQTIVQHPDSVFAEIETTREFVTNRSWKRLALGATTAATGWGLAGLASMIPNPIGIVTGAFGGIVGGFGITYSDAF